MKKILALILALTMIMSLAACGSAPEEPKATEPAPVETQPAPTEPVVQEPQTNAERYPLQSD